MPTTEHSTESFRAIPNYAVPTLKLIERMRHGKIGDELTDEELSRIAGCPVGVGKEGYSYLLSARNYCHKEGVFWQRVRNGQKIKCLDDLERLDANDSDKQRARKALKRTVLRAASINRDNLNTDEQRRLDAQAIQASNMLLFSDASTTKQIEAHSDKIVEAVDRKRVMALFLDAE